jgi:hypothetical protein
MTTPGTAHVRVFTMAIINGTMSKNNRQTNHCKISIKQYHFTTFFLARILVCPVVVYPVQIL